MKKILLYLSIILLAGACSNQEIVYPDFDYTAVYFPLQSPVRTLILGEDRIDNSLDKELKFHIGAVIGGLYENTKTWTVDYVVDNALAANLLTSTGDTIRALPTAYYTLTPQNTLTIPSGTFSGLVQVQLTDAFLDDPLAITGKYVIPLRMTGTNADKIMTGVPVVDNPDRRDKSHWDASYQPKDYTLFGIKFINPYHGFYLHRGKDITYDEANVKIGEVEYRDRFVERDQIWEVVTTGRNEALAKGTGINAGSDYGMKLIVSSNGDIVIDSVLTATYMVSGTGKYVEDGGEWGGNKYNAMYLQYQYKEGVNNHVVNDTLVFRNNGVIYEENIISLIAP